jgi:hypothetical protein
MKKIWGVTIGNNYSRHTVEARNFIEAAKKGLKLARPISREENWVSRIECVEEVEA